LAGPCNATFQVATGAPNPSMDTVTVSMPLVLAGASSALAVAA
jgi:hypothetical protein